MQIRLTNMISTPLAVSFRAADKRQVQVIIPVGSYKDVSDQIIPEELLRDATIKDLIRRGVMRVVFSPETADPPMLGDQVVDTAGFVEPKYLRIQCASGGSAGTADDVTVLASVPYDM